MCTVEHVHVGGQRGMYRGVWWGNLKERPRGRYRCKSESKVQNGLTGIRFNFSVLDSSGSTSNRNEYQEYFLGVQMAGA